MKKKQLVYFLLLLFSVVIQVGCSSKNNESSLGSIEGIFLKSTEGSNMILDDGGAITMSNQTGDATIFDDLKSGDTIKVTYDEIAESYPAQTTIYSCELIERGSKEDIPQDSLDQLQEMGWAFELDV